jgi:hypothetical protein
MTMAPAANESEHAPARPAPPAEGSAADSSGGSASASQRRERGRWCALEARDVQGVRAFVTMLLRLTAVAMIGVGAISAGKLLSLGLIGRDDVSVAWRVQFASGEWQGFHGGLMLVITGVTLALLARRITVWAVRPPAQGCPSCGYALPAVGEAERRFRCSECGYVTVR